jgi:hypothetical protein
MLVNCGEEGVVLLDIYSETSVEVYVKFAPRNRGRIVQNLLKKKQGVRFCEIYFCKFDVFSTVQHNIELFH